MSFNPTRLSQKEVVRRTHYCTTILHYQLYQFLCVCRDPRALQWDSGEIIWAIIVRDTDVLYACRVVSHELLEIQRP